jgi:hypothetical protein
MPETNSEDLEKMSMLLKENGGEVPERLETADITEYRDKLFTELIKVIVK